MKRIGRNEKTIQAISELLKRVPDEKFGEKEIRLYVFGATALADASWRGAHGVVGRVLPCYAVTSTGRPAFPDRWKEGGVALWVYDMASRKYRALDANCPVCGKVR